MSKSEQIEKLKNEPLSSFLIEPLLLAVEALGALQHKICSCNVLELISETMLIKDLQCYYAMQEIDFSCKDMFLELSCEYSSTELNRKYSCIKKCQSYVDSTVNTMGFLPATDFLRVNYQIMYPDRDVLNDRLFAAIAENKDAWNAIDGLYKENPYLHELFELAIASYQLEGLCIPHEVNLIAKNMLFSSYLKSRKKLKCNVIYLCKGYVVADKFVEFEKQEACEDYISYFLRFCAYAFEACYALIDSIEEQYQLCMEKIMNGFPKMYSQGLCVFFGKHISFKYSDLCKELHVTSKTAQGYLKSLEEAEILFSKKIGKERVYVNSTLLHGIGDQYYG